MSRNLKLGLLGCFLLAMLGGSVSARACNVPVFRYALEKWDTDAYQVVIFGRGEPDGQAQSLIQELKRQSQLSAANVEIHVVDLAKEMKPSFKELLGKHAELSVPWAAVLYPVFPQEPNAEPEVAWVGAFDRPALGGLIDSPKRREISRHLLQGDSVVWVLLESGDKKKDAAASRLIAEGLASFMNERGSSEEPPPEIALSLNVPLKLAFSTVVVSRQDAAEEWFVRLLLHLYPQVAESREPIVFPVFGRGRALGAATGPEVKASSIAVACEYLTGDCACEIKDRNPGRDLLIAVDWEGSLGERVVFDKPLPPLRGVLADAPTMPVTGPPTVPATTEASAPLRANPLLRNVAIALGGLALLVGAISIFILCRKRRGKVS